MWQITAAQRNLLLSRSKEDEQRTEKEKKLPKLYSLDELREIARNNSGGPDRVTADRSDEISSQSEGAAGI